jgi:hypothetical protein
MGVNLLFFLRNKREAGLQLALATSDRMLVGAVAPLHMLRCISVQGHSVPCLLGNRESST